MASLDVLPSLIDGLFYQIQVFQYRRPPSARASRVFAVKCRFH